MAWLCTKQWRIATMLIALVGTSRAEINLELNQAKIGTIAVKIKPDSADKQDKHVHDIVRIIEKDLGYSEKIAVVSNANRKAVIYKVGCNSERRLFGIIHLQAVFGNGS